MATSMASVPRRRAARKISRGAFRPKRAVLGPRRRLAPRPRESCRTFTTSEPWATRSALLSTFTTTRQMRSELQARPTVAEIDGRALADNFAELGRIAGRAGVLPVVKSDAYGHGLTLVGRVL